MLRNKPLLGSFDTPDNIGSPFGLIDVLLVFFAWLGSQFVAVAIGLLALQVSPGELADLGGQEQVMLMAIIGVCQLIATVLALGILYARYGSLAALGIFIGKFWEDVRLGFYAFVLVIPIVLVVQWLLTLIVDYEHPSLEMLTRDGGFFAVGVVWFTAGFVAPVAEEVFFRGLLQGWLQRLGKNTKDFERIVVGGWDQAGSAEIAVDVKPTKPLSNTDNPYESPQVASGVQAGKSSARSWITAAPWPIFLTSFLFAAAHMGQGAAPIPLFIFALALGYLYRKTGSIMPCIVLHMLLNMFSLFWFTLNVYFGEPVVDEPAIVEPAFSLLIFGF